MTTIVAPETLPIPASHLDLLTRPVCGVLTTMGADGQPQSSLVWVDHDGKCRDPRLSPDGNERSFSRPTWTPVGCDRRLRRLDGWFGSAQTAN